MLALTEPNRMENIFDHFFPPKPTTPEADATSSVGTMYISDSDFRLCIAQLEFPSVPVGDAALTSQAWQAASGDSVEERINVAFAVRAAIHAALPQSSTDGPAYTIRTSGGMFYDLALVTLPGFRLTGQRLYLFEAPIGQPLCLRELWYSHAPCFSPIAPDPFASLRVPLDDDMMWRERTLDVLRARNAAFHDLFFPSQP